MPISRYTLVLPSRLIFLFALLTGQAAETDWDALNEKMVALYEDEKFKEGIDLAESAIAAREELGPSPDEPGFVTALYNLSGFYLEVGDFTKATLALERCLQTRNRPLGADDIDWAPMLTRLVTHHEEQGNYNTALYFLERLIELHRVTLDLKDRDYLVSLHWFAGLYRVLGRLEEAAAVYNQLLPFVESGEVFAPEEGAQILLNLAFVHEDQGSYHDAFPLAERAVKLLEDALGPFHEAVAGAFALIGRLHFFEGRIGEAQRFCDQAQLILQQKVGPTDPAWIRTLDLRARLCSERGEDREAVEIRLRVALIVELEHGPNHPLTARFLKRLADAHIVDGEYSKAIDLLNRTLEIRGRLSDSNRSDTAAVLESMARAQYGLATAHLGTGNPDEAEALYENAMMTFEKVFGPASRDVGNCLLQMARLHKDKENYSKSIEFVERGAKVLEKVLGPDHPEIAVVLHELAKLYRETNRGERAGELEKEVERIRLRMTKGNE